jgi:hypothetical protein
MKTFVSRILLAGLCGALLVPLATGCGNNEATLSKDEAKNFKGGPMPPEAAAAMRGGGPPRGAQPAAARPGGR